MTFKTSTDVAVWDASVFEWSVYHGEMLAGGVYLGADADVARTRAVAACKDFLTFWKDADPEPPHLQASQSRVCQAAMFAANLQGKTDNSRLVCKSVKLLPVL